MTLQHRIVLVSLFTLLTSIGSIGAVPFARLAAKAERAPANNDTMSHQRSAALHATLRADAVPTEAPVRVERSSVPLDASPSAGERRVRVGAAHATDLRVEFATLSPRHLNATPRKVARGAIRETASGGFVWTGVVETPGAAAMRLRFSNFFLPRNGEL